MTMPRTTLLLGALTGVILRKPPAPHLPPETITQAAARYQDICERLIGEKVAKGSDKQ